MAGSSRGYVTLLGYDACCSKFLSLHALLFTSCVLAYPCSMTSMLRQDISALGVKTDLCQYFEHWMTKLAVCWLAGRPHVLSAQAMNYTWDAKHSELIR